MPDDIPQFILDLLPADLPLFPQIVMHIVDLQHNGFQFELIFLLFTLDMQHFFLQFLKSQQNILLILISNSQLIILLLDILVVNILILKLKFQFLIFLTQPYQLILLLLHSQLKILNQYWHLIDTDSKFH